MKKVHLLLVVIGLLLSCSNKNELTKLPPSWAKEAVWYQIFVERFCNGDTTNDPKPENMYNALSGYVAKDWTVTPWTQDWYSSEPWAANNGKSFADNLQDRRYGGDLQGVINKLDYLLDLGINAIYLNPINDAPSLHKYDARNYHHIDVNFGPDPEGDVKIIASENPSDPNTWQWTAADKLFIKLLDEAHKRNIRVIMDYSWNHTGTEFWAFRDIAKNGDKSKFTSWYTVKSFDNPATKENEFEYLGWFDNKYMPEIRKTDLVSPKNFYHPHEGNINDGAKHHIFEVCKRWLSPNGNTSRGVDGFRLDVADFIPLGFWRDYRTYIKSIKADAYLVGEAQWWMDKMMAPEYYTNSEVFDAVIFYHAYRPARNFFSKANDSIDAHQLADSLKQQWAGLEAPFRYSMMNVSSTHDTPRLLSCFYNHGKYKSKAKPYEDSTFKTGKPDAETYQRVKLYLIHQFTNVGAPSIWNGEEMGMWGGDDPDCRKPLWWKELQFEPELRNNIKDGETLYDSIKFNQEHFEFFRKLVHIRRNNPILSTGEIEFTQTEGKTLAYKRFDNKNCLYVLFNLEPTDKTFTLPSNKKYIDLITNSSMDGNEIKLKPLTGLILLEK